MLMTTPVLADSMVQSINVILNGVEVQVDGEKINSDSILYDGTTYLPMRIIIEAVGKDIEWNQETLTATF